MVQRVINSSYHSAIGTSPARVVYGDRVNLDRGLFVDFEENRQNSQAVVSYEDHIQDLNNQLKVIIEASQKHQAKVVAERLSKSPADPTRFHEAFIFRYCTA